MAKMTISGLSNQEAGQMAEALQILIGCGRCELFMWEETLMRDLHTALLDAERRPTSVSKEVRDKIPFSGDILTGAD